MKQNLGDPDPRLFYTNRCMLIIMCNHEMAPLTYTKQCVANSVMPLRRFSLFECFLRISTINFSIINTSNYTFYNLKCFIYILTGFLLALIDKCSLKRLTGDQYTDLQNNNNVSIHLCIYIVFRKKHPLILHNSQKK